MFRFGEKLEQSIGEKAFTQNIKKLPGNQEFLSPQSKEVFTGSGEKMLNHNVKSIRFRRADIEWKSSPMKRVK